eukprot:scaffold412_cov116-Isochrysis_galbana.AAC.5
MTSSCSNRPALRTAVCRSPSSSISFRLSAPTTSLLSTSSVAVTCSAVGCLAPTGASAAAAMGSLGATGGTNSHRATGSWSEAALRAPEFDARGATAFKPPRWLRSPQTKPACFTANKSSAALSSIRWRARCAIWPGCSTCTPWPWFAVGCSCASSSSHMPSLSAAKDTSCIFRTQEREVSGGFLLAAAVGPSAWTVNGVRFVWLGAWMEHGVDTAQNKLPHGKAAVGETRQAGLAGSSLEASGETNNWQLASAGATWMFHSALYRDPTTLYRALQKR